MERTNAIGLCMVRKIIIKLISGYQYCISPFLPASCIFEVSCSEYAKIIISEQGIINGSWLVILRIIKCQQIFNHFGAK